VHSSQPRQNLASVGSAGISKENRSRGFRAVFHEVTTGRTVMARFADGRPAPTCPLDGLPADRVVKRDVTGHARAVKDSAIAGFVCNHLFYTREEATAALQ
jgi:hypothetical protein